MGDIKKLSMDREKLLLKRAELLLRSDDIKASLMDYVAAYEVFHNRQIYELILEIYLKPIEKELKQTYERNQELLSAYPCKEGEMQEKDVKVHPLWMDDNILLYVNLEERTFSKIIRKGKQFDLKPGDICLFMNELWREDLIQYENACRVSEPSIGETTPFYLMYDRQYWLLFLQIMDLEELMSAGRVFFLAGRQNAYKYWGDAGVFWPQVKRWDAAISGRQNTGESEAQQWELWEKNISLLQKKKLYYGPSMDTLKKNRQKSEEFWKISENADTGKISKGMPVLFVNERNLHSILEAYQKIGNAYVPLYLYYDCDFFCELMRSQDICLLMKIEAIVIVVGRDAFYSLFSAYEVVYPKVYFGDKGDFLFREIENFARRREELICSMKMELEVYYWKNFQEIADRIKEKTATICVLKNTFEPGKFQKFYKQFQKVAENMGYRVVICEEEKVVFRMPEIVNLYRYRPDMVFQIDKQRSGDTFLGEALDIKNMEALVYVNWIQDIHPAVLSPNYAKKLKERDFVFSIFEKEVLEEYQFPDKNVIYGGIMAVDEEEFAISSITPEEHEKYDCDICFAGSVIGKGGEEFICASLDPYLKTEQVDKVVDSLFEMLDNLYDAESGRYAICGEQVQKPIRQLQNELGFDDDVKLHIYRVFVVMRYEVLRFLILKQLARSGRYKINFYGATDPEIEGIHFCGFVANEELAKAMQCAKMTLQINPDTTMNQRIAESLLSHTMVMVYQMKREDDMSSVMPYLQEGEGISFFDSREELLKKCDYFLTDSRVREAVAECGYQKVREKMTVDTVYGHLLEKVREKLSGGKGNVAFISKREENMTDG